MPRCRSRKLGRYGDSMVLSAAECRNRAARPEADIARMSGVRGAGPESWMTQRAEKRRWRQRKAIASAIGGRRRRADAPLRQPRPVIMLPLARWVAHVSVARGRRPRR